MDVDSDSEPQTAQTQQLSHPPFDVVNFDPSHPIQGFSVALVRQMLEENSSHSDPNSENMFRDLSAYVERIKRVVAEEKTVAAKFDRNAYDEVVASEQVETPVDENDPLITVARNAAKSSVGVGQPADLCVTMGHGEAFSLEEVLKFRFMDILADSNARQILLDRFQLGEKLLIAHVAHALDEQLEQILELSIPNAEIAHGAYKLLSTNPKHFEHEQAAAIITKATQWLHSRSQGENVSPAAILARGNLVKVFTSILQLHTEAQNNPYSGGQYGKLTSECTRYYFHLCGEIPTEISLSGDCFWKDFMSQLFIIHAEPSQKYLSISAIRLASTTGELGQVIHALDILGNELIESRQGSDEDRWKKLFALAQESIINVSYLAGPMIQLRKVQLVYEAAKNVSRILDGRWNNLFGTTWLCTWAEDSTLFEKVFDNPLAQFVVEDILLSSIATKLKISWLKRTLVGSCMDQVECLVARQWIRKAWGVVQRLRLVKEVGLSEEKKDEWRSGGVFLVD